MYKEYLCIKRQLLVFEFIFLSGTYLCNIGLNINRAKILHLMRNVIMRTQQCHYKKNKEYK